METPQHILLTDDIALCKLTRDQFEHTLKEWRSTQEEINMRIIRAKTEYMSTVGVEDMYVQLQSDRLSSVKQFQFFGSDAEISGRLDEQVQHKVTLGQMNWKKMSRVLCVKQVSYKMKGKLYKMGSVSSNAPQCGDVAIYDGLRAKDTGCGDEKMPTMLNTEKGKEKEQDSCFEETAKSLKPISNSYQTICR